MLRLSVVCFFLGAWLVVTFGGSMMFDCLIAQQSSFDVDAMKSAHLLGKVIGGIAFGLGAFIFPALSWAHKREIANGEE